MNPFTRLSEFIEDWLFLIKRDGLDSAIHPITNEILQIPYRHLHYVIFSCPLDNSTSNLESRIQFEVRQFERTDLDLIHNINRPSEARLCARHFEMGHYGFIALRNAEVLGYAWACAEIDNQVERVSIKLESGDILFNDAFTTPAYRGQGVQTAITKARLKFAKKLGYKRAVCYIETKNTPSIHVWKDKLNSSIIGRIDFTRIGAWYRTKLYAN